MQKFIGVKRVCAQKMTRSAAEAAKLVRPLCNDNEDQNGYMVRYPDGYESWSPDDVFESTYFPLHADDGIDICPQDVLGFVSHDIKTAKLSENVAIAQATCLTGFEIVETSTSDCPSTYDATIAAAIATGKVHDRLASFLTFVLIWARNGLKR